MKMIKNGFLPVVLTTTVMISFISNIVYAEEANTTAETEISTEAEVTQDTTLDSSEEDIYEETITEVAREITETNTIDICQIAIEYTKEVEIYDGFLPTGNSTTITLKSNIQVEAGAKLSDVELDSETESILEKAHLLSSALDSSYTIKAAIDKDNVSVLSVTKTSIKHDSTDVTVYEVMEKHEKHKKETTTDTDESENDLTNVENPIMDEDSTILSIDEKENPDTECESDIETDNEAPAPENYDEIDVSNTQDEENVSASDFENCVELEDEEE